MMTPRPSEPQAGLFDEDPPASSGASQEGEPVGTRHETSFDDPTEPAPNSREDLGFTRPGADRPEGVDDRPPREKSFGDPSPGPDPVPDNHARSAIQIADARKFVTWIHDQEIAIHEDVTVGHVLVALSGWGTDSLAWLCRACRQAGQAPAPAKMRAAWVAKDVGLLRPGEEPKKAASSRQEN